MRGSIQIAKCFGIPVLVHWSFLLLGVFVVYVGKSKNADWGNIAVFGLFVLALFFCVILHEFGHALSAKYYGVNTRDITILPIGGMARLDKLPEKPFQEFVVAVAGPAVNVVIFVVLSLFLSIFYDIHLTFRELMTSEVEEIIIDPKINFLITLIQANLWLVVFNMIPAFPMDGGRVFRALLAMQIGRTQATRIAAFFGQAISMAFFVYALMPLFKDLLPDTTMIGEYLNSIKWQFQPVLSLISIFIFYNARSEYKHVRMDEILSRHTISNILRTHFTRLKTSDLVQTAASEMKKGNESNFLVFDDDDLLRGLLQDDDVLDSVKNKDYNALVMTYMTTNFQRAKPFDSIREVYYKMLNSGQYLTPVMNGDELIGVVDMAMLQNFIASHEKVS